MYILTDQNYSIYSIEQSQCILCASKHLLCATEIDVSAVENSTACASSDAHLLLGGCEHHGANPQLQRLLLGRGREDTKTDLGDRVSPTTTTSGVSAQQQQDAAALHHYGTILRVGWYLDELYLEFRAAVHWRSIM